MIEQPNFSETATNKLSDLISRFKMKVRKKNESEFELENEKYRVRVSLFSGHLPSITAVVGPFSDHSIEYGVGAILDACECESIAYVPAELSSKEDLERDLALLAQALAECLIVLEGIGDVVWRKIDLNVKEKVKRWEHQRKEKGSEVFEATQRIRAAELAFSQRDYKKAAALWHTVEDWLSQLEQKRFAYARLKS